MRLVKVCTTCKQKMIDTALIDKLWLQNPANQVIIMLDVGIANVWRTAVNIVMIAVSIANAWETISNMDSLVFHRC